MKTKTLNVSARVDIRDIALASDYLDSLGIEIRTVSELLRTCLSTLSDVITKSTEFTKPNHEQALNGLIGKGIVTRKMKTKALQKALADENLKLDPASPVKGADIPKEIFEKAMKDLQDSDNDVGII